MPPPHLYEQRTSSYRQHSVQRSYCRHQYPPAFESWQDRLAFRQRPSGSPLHQSACGTMLAGDATAGATMWYCPLTW